MVKIRSLELIKNFTRFATRYHLYNTNFEGKPFNGCLWTTPSESLALIVIPCITQFSIMWCKKDVTPPFFKKRRNFLSFTSFCRLHLFLSFKKTQFLFIHICLIIRPVIRLCYPRSYPHGFWWFPIWLTTTFSYPMEIFSANEIRTF